LAKKGILGHISAGEIILAAGAFGSPAILLRSGIGPASHLSDLGIAMTANLPVGNRLQDHPVFYNVYALKPEANKMTPAVGALIWTQSETAEHGELDLHICATHLINPAVSPTGGAIVLRCAVTLPRSIGRLRLSSPLPRAAPHINYNFFDDENDLNRLIEAVRLSRKISQTTPFCDVTDHEIAPGYSVEDGKSLRGKYCFEGRRLSTPDIDSADGIGRRSNGRGGCLGESPRRRGVAGCGRFDSA
jgi:choline dehydrogenase